jgi:ribosome-binding factor A
MRPFRDLKIASVIQEQLAKILARDFFVEGALVTVMNVVLDDDLLHARVKIGIIPYEKGPEVFEALEKNRREFQHKLLKKMNIKPMPQIKFELEEQDVR